MSIVGFGFNPGSALGLSVPEYGEAAANAAVSTGLAGAAGGISALFTNLYLEERRTGEPHFSLLMAMNGTLSGLVAITSGCALVEPWAAIVIGIVSGWIYIYSSALLLRVRIDDAVDAIPVHMFNGTFCMDGVVRMHEAMGSLTHQHSALNSNRYVGSFCQWFTCLASINAIVLSQGQPCGLVLQPGARIV